MIFTQVTKSSSGIQGGKIKVRMETFLWQGPYVIFGYRGNNTFFLRNIDVLDLPRGPVNGRMLKHYLSTDLQQFILFSTIVHSIARVQIRLDGNPLNLKPREKALSFKRFTIISINNADSHKDTLQCNINNNSKATNLRVLDISLVNAIPKWSHYQGPIVIGFIILHWLNLSLVILYIPLLSANVFHIKN